MEKFNEETISLLAFEYRNRLADKVMDAIRDKATEVAKTGGCSFMFFISSCLGFKSPMVGEEVEKRVKTLGFYCEPFDKKKFEVDELGISWKVNPSI